MRPKKQIDVGQQDLFRNRLDQIIDLNHPLSRLTQLMDWDRLHKEFSPYYADVGRAALPIRLMVGLNLLKHIYACQLALNIDPQMALKNDPSRLLKNGHNDRSKFF